jgi:hypothetical protein
MKSILHREQYPCLSVADPLQFGVDPDPTRIRPSQFKIMCQSVRPVPSSRVFLIIFWNRNDVSACGGSASRSILPQNTRFRLNTVPKPLRFPKHTYHDDLFPCVFVTEASLLFMISFIICYFPFII